MVFFFISALDDEAALTLNSESSEGPALPDAEIEREIEVLKKTRAEREMRKRQRQADEPDRIITPKTPYHKE